jgi:hypothetical protein
MQTQNDQLPAPTVVPTDEARQGVTGHNSRFRHCRRVRLRILEVEPVRQGFVAGWCGFRSVTRWEPRQGAGKRRRRLQLRAREPGAGGGRLGVERMDTLLKCLYPPSRLDSLTSGVTLTRRHGGKPPVGAERRGASARGGLTERVA